MKKILLFSLLFLSAVTSINAQAPVNFGKYYYNSGVSGCIWYRATDNPTLALGGYFIMPNGAAGLAIGSNLGFSAPNPTYWTTVGGIYYYYNGTSFVSTGHGSGGTDFINPGASQNYIYNMSSSGQVSRYNGTGASTIISTFTYGVVYDIVADQNDNFYVLKNSLPQSLSIYNSSGNLTCSYSVSNCPVMASGLAINKGVVNVLDSYNGNSNKAVFDGNALVFNSSTMLGCSPVDLASFPADVTMTPPLTATPAVLPCLGGTLSLSSNNSFNINSYSWSGPGIIGSVSGQSIAVNTPGIYSRTVATCAGPFDVTTFTVAQAVQSPVLVSQSANIKCGNAPPVSLSVSGLGNYSWTPSASLSSSTGSNVSANPNVTTIYTVSGQLNNCIGSATLSIAASIIPNLNAVSSTPSLCAGSVAYLNSQAGNLTLNWMPGNYSTASFTIVPSQSTTYTLTGTDALGCTRSETVAISVFNVPTLQVAANSSEICLGDSVTITASGAVNFNYLPGNSTSGVLSVLPQSTTVYTVTGSNWNCSDTKTISVTVHDLPQLNLSSSSPMICAGQSANLIVSGADSYLWDSGSTNSQLVVSPAVTTTYSVTGNSTFGCSSSASIVQGVSECTGINSISIGDALKIYPNPGNGRININRGNLTDDCTIAVYNSIGQEVFKKLLSETDGSVDLQNAAQGIYVVLLSIKEQTVGSLIYFHE